MGLVLVLGSLCAVSPDVAAAPDALLCGPFWVRFAYGYAAIWSAPARNRPHPHPADMLYDAHRAAEMVLVVIGEGITRIMSLPRSQQLPYLAYFALAFFLLTAILLRLTAPRMRTRTRTPRRTCRARAP